MGSRALEAWLRRSTKRIVAIASALFVCACGSSGGSAPPPAPAADAGDAGIACAADEVLTATGRCEKPGIPEDQCGAALAADGQRGCKAILPDAPCPDGQVAFPGERSCHAVADCGAAPWGAIPLAGTVVYVDAAAPAGGDGSAAKPLRTLTEATALAAEGATIAVAAGSYVEDISLVRQGVKLWGRCPSMVEIVGTGDPALFLGANDTEVHAVAVRGQKSGIGVTGAGRTLVDHVWVHDTQDAGVAVIDAVGPAQLSLRDVLIERPNGTGFLLSGAQADLTRVAIRDVQLRTTGATGLGVISSPATKRASKISIDTALVERSFIGITIAGSDGALQNIVVRDTSPTREQEAEGITFAYNDRPATVTLQRAVVERARTAGVFVAGANATIDALTVVDTLPESAARPIGYGLAVQGLVSPQVPSTASVTHVRIDKATGAGVTVVDADTTLESAIVSSTRPTDRDGVADGLLAWSNLASATARIHASRIERSDRAGIASFGAAVELAGTVLSCNRIALDGEDVGDRRASFEDKGANTCGCDAARGACTVVSSNLTPPLRPN